MPSFPFRSFLVRRSSSSIAFLQEILASCSRTGPTILFYMSLKHEVERQGTSKQAIIDSN